MEEKATIMDAIIEKAETLGTTSIELFKLRTIDKVSEFLSITIGYSIVLITGFLSLMVLNFGVAIWLGKILDSTFSGFFIVAGFYALVLCIFILFRKQFFIRPLKNSIINMALKNE